MQPKMGKMDIDYQVSLNTWFLYVQGLGIIIIIFVFPSCNERGQPSFFDPFFLILTFSDAGNGSCLQVLHDAFFKYQTKPKLTAHGDLYHEGKEFEV